MVALEAHNAPERKLARSTLLPVVLSGMSAFDSVIFCSLDHLQLVLQHLPQTVNEPTVGKAEKRLVDLSRRRASSDRKSRYMPAGGGPQPQRIPRHKDNVLHLLANHDIKFSAIILGFRV